MAIDVVTLLAACLSSAAFVALGIGWSRIPKQTTKRQSSGALTVIVAAHDEAAHIGSLLAALGRQTYPLDRINVVIVDDRSGDGTGDAARAAVPEGLNVTILRIDAVPPDVSPKKYALHTGIAASDAEILLFTDADCIPDAGWVEGMAAVFAESGTDVVIGLAPLRPGAGFASWYAAYESVRTAMLSCAAAGWKRPYMAIGRNWGYRRRVYDDIGGLAPLFSSLGGDDDLLLQRMTASGARVAVCARAETCCRSDAPADMRALVRAKLRHYRASFSYPARIKYILASFGLLELIAIVAAPVYLLLAHDLHPLLIAVTLCGKLLYDTKFLHPAARMMGFDMGFRMRCGFAFLEWWHTVFSHVVGSLSILKKPRW